MLKPCTSIDEDEDEGTTIELNSAINLTYSLKYLLTFTKAAVLSKYVTLSMSTEIPLLVEYKVNDVGYVRFYLAPKQNDE
jgi:proliferating cell nuclear antigen